MITLVPEFIRTYASQNSLSIAELFAEDKHLSILTAGDVNFYSILQFKFIEDLFGTNYHVIEEAMANMGAPLPKIDTMSAKLFYAQNENRDESKTAFSGYLLPDTYIDKPFVLKTLVHPSSLLKGKEFPLYVVHLNHTDATEFMNSDSVDALRKQILMSNDELVNHIPMVYRSITV